MPDQLITNETAIWRYMSLDRFVPMLESKLYFPRPLQFDDRWEGRFPPSYIRRLRNQPYTPDNSFAADFLSNRGYRSERCYFVSCWHASEHESDAMWRLYGLAPRGVAVKTTVGDLHACFNPDGGGAVEYYDPAKNKKPSDNSDIEDIQWKRKDFEWEQEYRIWFKDRNLLSAFHDEPDMTVTQPLEGEYRGIEDLSRLIRQIVVAPFSKPQFRETLESVLTHFNKRYLIDRIQRSHSERTWDEMARGH